MSGLATYSRYRSLKPIAWWSPYYEDNHHYFHALRFGRGRDLGDRVGTDAAAAALAREVVRRELDL